MDGMKQDIPIKQFAKIFGEISGYVANILAYILAITENLPTPYPSTVSTLTVFVSLTVLWLWRWPRITERKPAITGVLTLHEDQSVTDTTKNHLLDPVRAANNRFYKTTLFQRRAEIGILFTLTLFALTSGIMKIPSIGEEITGLNCPKGSQNTRIVVADFVSSNSHQFENSLANVMSMQMRNVIQVCRYNHPVELLEDAEEKGEKYNATLIIWGSNIDEIFEVYLTATEWEMLSQREDEGLSPKNSQEDIALLAAYALTEILFYENNHTEAQEYLSRTLDSISQGNSNSDLLAEGYFLLGLLFDPNQYPEDSSIPDTERAIQEYSNAIRFNQNMESAYLNRAAAHFKKGDFERAIEDYGTLISIAENSDNKFDAYLIRADLLLAQGKCLNVISDLETAFGSPDVEEYYLYQYLRHKLGVAQIICGNYNTAEETYKSMLPIDTDYAAIIMGELNGLIVLYPEDDMLKEEVFNILEILGK